MAEIRTVIGGQVYLNHLNLTVSGWRNVMANIEVGNIPYVRFFDTVTGKDVLLNPRECAIIEFQGDQEVMQSLNDNVECCTMDDTDSEEDDDEADA